MKADFSLFGRKHGCGLTEGQFAALVHCDECEKRKARDAQRLKELDEQIAATKKKYDLLNTSDEHDEERGSTAGRLGGLRWARTLLVEEAKT